MAPPSNDVESDWIGPAQGDWSDPADWSDGVPATAGTIALLGGSNEYDVTIGTGESYAPDSVLLDDPLATLLVNGTLATTGGISIESGTLDDAGSLSGPLAVDGGILLTIGSSPFTLDSAVNLAGGTISWLDTLTGTADVTLAAGTAFVGSGVIADATDVQPGYNGGTVVPPLKPVLLTNFGTIETTPTLAGGGAGFLDLENTSLGNQGLIETDGGSVYIESETFDNAAGATLEGLGGASLSLYDGFTNEGLITETGGELYLGEGHWTNTGSIVADDATVLLGGDETQGDMGAFTRLGTTSIELAGTLENAGTTLNAGSTLLAGLTLAGGEIAGGTVDVAAFGLSFEPYDNNTFDGVTVINGLSLDSGGVTLTDGSTVYADADAMTLATIDVGAGGTLGFAGTADYAIAQDVSESGGFVALNGPFTLESTIAGTGGTVELGGPYLYDTPPGTWVNDGGVALSGGVVDLNGNETVAQIGDISDPGGTIFYIGGTLDNIGGTLDGSDTSLLGLQLQGGTIQGGTLDVAALGLGFSNYYYDAGNVLAGVTLINGLTVASGSVTLTDGSAVYTDAAADTLATIDVTGGTLALSGTAGYTINQDISVSDGVLALDGPFTLDSTITVTGGLVALGGTDVTAESTWINDGLIQLGSGATLELNGDETVAQIGSIDNSGGTILYIGGTLDNVGGTLNGSDTSLLGLQLAGGTIEGGTLDAGALNLQPSEFYYYSGGDLDNVTLINNLAVDGSLDLSGSTAVYADSTATTPGTITVGSEGVLSFVGSGPFTLDNQVTLNGGALTWAAAATYGTTTATVDAAIAAGDIVSGYGRLAAAQDDSTVDLTVLGTIDADTAYSTLAVAAASLVNDGLIETSSGGSVALGTVTETYDPNAGTYTYTASTFVNDGTIALDGGTLLLDVDATAAQIGYISNNAGAILYQAGTLDNTGSILNGSDTSLLGLQLAGGTIEGGTLDTEGLGFGVAPYYYNASALDNVTVINNLTVAGSLDLTGSTAVFADSTATQPGSISVADSGNLAFVGAGPFTLDNPVTLAGGGLTWEATAAYGTTTTTVDATIAAADLVSGYGAIAAAENDSTVDLTVLGTIDADTTYETLTVGAASLINDGVLEADAGAALQLGTVTSVYDPATESYIKVASTLLNDGVITLDGGSLYLEVDATAAQLGTISNSGGTLFYAGGTLDNTGGTLNAADTSLIGLQLAGGTIEGGTLDAAGLGFGVADVYGSSTSDLDNVTVLNDLTADGTVLLTGSTAIYADAAADTPGTITAEGFDGAVIFVGAGPATLDNPVLLDGGAVSWAADDTYAATLTTLDVTVPAGGMVSGYGTFAASVNNTTIDLTNLGTIDADTVNQVLTVAAAGLLNQGLIESTNGGTLQVGTTAEIYNPATNSYETVASTIANQGTILLNGGVLDLDVDATVARLGTIVNNGGAIYYQEGTLDNIGGTLNAADTSLLGLNLDGGTIEGGTLDTTGLGFQVLANYYYDYGISYLDNVTVINNLVANGPVVLSGSTAVYADATATTPGTITVGNYTGVLAFVGGGPFTLVNAVTLENGSLTWAGNNGGTYQPATVTIAADVEVQGYGYIEDRYLSGNATDDVTNLGTIAATQTYGAYLSISTTEFDNQGTLLADNGGTVYLEPTTLDNLIGGTLSGGTYIADAGSGIAFGYDESITTDAADLVLTGPGAYNSAQSTLSQVAAGGTLEVDNGAGFSGSNALSVAGLVSLGGGTLTEASVAVAPGGTLAGFGTVNAAGGVTSDGVVEASGGALVLDAPITDAETLDVAAFATLELSGADNAVVDMSGVDAVLALDNGGSLFTGTIDNFTSGDAILLNGFAGTSAVFADGVLTVSNDTGSVALNVAGDFAADAFVASLPGATETEITLGAPSSLAVAAPGTLLDNPGTVIAVPGVQVSDALGATVTVDINAQYGVLAASAEDGGIEQGNGTGSLILSGGLAAVDAELATLEYQAPGVGTFTDAIAIDAFDNAGGTSSALIGIAVNQPPTIDLPADLLAQSGTAATATGLSVTDPDTVAGEIYTVTVSDTAGILDATTEDGASVINGDSTSITLSGALDGVNAELSTLTFTGTADDSLAVSVDGGRGGLRGGFVPVYVNQPPTVSAPGTVQGFIGIPAPVSGIDVIDPYGAAVGDTFTVLLTAGLGTLEGTQAAGATLAGDGTGTLTLSGSLGAVNAELASLQYVGPSAGYVSDSIDIDASDGVGGTATDSVLVIPPPPPALTLPDKFVVGGGLESPLDGVAVAVGAGLADNTMITLDLSDTVGTLGLKLEDGVAVTGNNSNDLTLVGEAGALNTALSSLIYTGGTSLDTSVSLDSIVFSASEDGASTSTNVPVDLPINGDNPAQPQSFAMLLLDSGLLAYLQYDNGDNAYVGTLYADLPAYYNFEGPPTEGSITFSVLNDNVVSATDDASAYQEPYAPVVGDWDTSGPFSVSGITGFFSTGQLITATDHTLKQPDTITYIFKSNASDAGQLPDRRLTIVFNKTTAVTTPSSPTSSSTSNGGGGGGGGHGGHGGNGDGDVHLTTYDGLYYNFQASGEFILAKSTQPGDTFQVQIRLQPWHTSASVSVITEAAVAVGTHRVTFDLTRANTVWLDGTPITLANDGTPTDLGAGTLQQLTPTSWQILYDSGETVRVTNEGSFLDVDTTIPGNAANNSVEGLLGNYNGNPANDLALPDGTVLQQPLSSAQLYTTFADAWRVTDATSLLDYGAGQTTATFTDPNFPSDAISLSSIPANVLENAEAMIAAAGITNPAAAESALEDYLLTGNTSFIAAETGSAPSVASVMQSPTNAATTSLGIAAIAPTVTLSATGTTAVGFELYEAGSDDVAQTVTYTVQPPSGLGIDIPTTGTVTIAAGETSATLDLDVLGTIVVPSTELDIQITAGTATPVVASSAGTVLDSRQPVAGPAAVPTFLDVSNVGTLIQNGDNFTLDLGTVLQGASVAPFLIDIANDAAIGADTLSGTIASTGSIVSFNNALPPGVTLAAGQLYQLTGSLDTSQAGSIDRTISLDAVDSNSSGYSADLGAYTLDIVGDIACFASGTRILTPDGEVAVEQLRVGDLVRTGTGDTRPIVWIGRRTLDCRRHPKPEQIWPVRIAADSFGPDLPHRALLLSPDHAVYTDGVLIPVKYLVNGTTIVQQRTPTVQYFHIELDCHDVVLANGLPAESYLDTGDRARFENSGLPLVLHPDFASRAWEARGYAPLVIVGPEVDAVRRVLRMQADRLAVRRAAGNAARRSRRRG